MMHTQSSSKHLWLRHAKWSALALLFFGTAGQAALTSLATSPLVTSSATLVKPNILFLLDDSGSMDWDFLPDWASSTSVAGLYRNNAFNGVYYNPAITYTPPLKYDGVTHYPSMTAAYTSNWTAVPYDGFGVQSFSYGFFNWGDPYTDLTTGNAYFYTFKAGEYCTTPKLKTCVTQSAPSTSYPYPAYVRWCTSSSMTNCQANRIDTAPSGGSTYTYVRYPGKSSSIPGSNNKTTITSSNNIYPYPGQPTKAATRTDCAGTTCTYAEEMTNFANWWSYYHTRMQMMKTSASLAFSVLDNSYRLGYMTINNNTGTDFINIQDIDSPVTSSGQKARWYSQLFSATPNNSTPLRVALSKAGQLYSGKLTKVNTVTVSDPMQYACQRNYTLAATDGYWNESSTPTQINGSTAIGNTDGSLPRPYLDGNNISNTLADVSAYYYNTDIRSSTYSNTLGVLGTDVASNSVADKQQRMYTSTMGLGASGYMLYQSNYQTAKSGDYYDVLEGTATSTTTASNGVCTWQTSGSCNWPKAVSNTQTTIDDLWHAAVNGHGTYYSATNPATLQSGLMSFLQNVSATTGNAAAATTSNPNVSSGDNYVFTSTFQSVTWYGEVARYSIDITTGAISPNADWSQSGTVYSNATTKTYATPLLDNTSYTSRTIYTYDPSASPSKLIPFQWSSLNSTIQGYFQMASIGTLTQMCSSGSACLAASAQVNSTTAGTTTGAGGINLVNFIRGDRSNEGPDNATYYRQRAHVLGDVVDSQAVYVKAPPYSYSDTGYAAYRTANASRQSMLYVGANDGMLHAFNADTGAEAWAYIPSMVLPSLYKLADKDYANKHAFYVNATPRSGDVYFGGAWHTILAGGLGRGGRGYYALDVTNPSSPQVLWEFTYDTTKTTGYTTDADLGYTYGTPIITKLSDGTWAVIVTSGYNNVSPGSGHGIIWVLNAQTGAIIKKIDTGTGSSTGTVAGCSTAPCPSGLSKISAYVDTTNTNNTALRVYGGDVFGNVWRVDLKGLTASGGSADVQLLATLADSSGNRQPITTRPEVSNMNGTTVIYVGTGAFLGLPDLTSSNTQSIYALKDPLTDSGAASGLYGSPRTSTCSAAMNSNCFVKQVYTDASGVRTATSTVAYPVDFSTMNGWYVDLPETGERANTDPDLQLGTLALTTNIPNSSDPCSTGGSSYVNYIDYKTGLNVKGSVDVGSLLTNGTTTSLASAVTLIRLPNGKVIGIVTPGNGGTPITTVAPVGSQGTSTRRISWRELITDN
ncbi:MAG: PQQ-binding-like beta-propeller repeat protein [Burkholderiales bacterium]|nr:PQQ-binding-like beta-propeller repeat protein [Burkholderiales bacterium]